MKKTILLGIAMLSLLGAACSTEPALEPESTESALAVPTATNSACSSPALRDCSFYAACLEAKHTCGADGYALGYGDRYCRRFLANDQLSAKGLVWRDETMRCLQLRLGRFLSKNTTSCTSILDGAFDDHPVCYTQKLASICYLPVWDWLSIIGTIDAADLLSRRGRKQMAETARTCLVTWAEDTWQWIAPPNALAQDTDDAERADLDARIALAEALDREPETSLERLRAIALDVPLPLLDRR